MGQDFTSQTALPCIDYGTMHLWSEPAGCYATKNNGLLSVGSHPPTLNREQWLFCRPDNWNTSDPAFIANWTTAHEAASASLHKPLVLEEVCQSSLQYWRCVSS